MRSDSDIDGIIRNIFFDSIQKSKDRIWDSDIDINAAAIGRKRLRLK